MPTHQSTIDYLLEQLRKAGAVSARKMFGEYALYRDGKLVALICDGQLYLKPTAAGRALANGCADGSPYPGAKPHILVEAGRWEDADWLTRIIEVSAGELPEPSKKKRKR